ncbi:hypothetical protein [Caballeronia sp. RCC_10]|uniref:hypothetical protein n=1 Tax=Caballeronia sp. RCC_10 TaxID=3239227 RepID=UPI00352533C6
MKRRTVSTLRRTLSLTIAQATASFDAVRTTAERPHRNKTEEYRVFLKARRNINVNGDIERRSKDLVLGLAPAKPRLAVTLEFRGGLLPLFKPSHNVEPLEVLT